jgi:hypothetical protein
MTKEEEKKDEQNKRARSNHSPVRKAKVALETAR